MPPAHALIHPSYSYILPPWTRNKQLEFEYFTREVQIEIPERPIPEIQDVNRYQLLVSVHYRENVTYAIARYHWNGIVCLFFLFLIISLREILRKIAIRLNNRNYTYVLGHVISHSTNEPMNNKKNSWSRNTHFFSLSQQLPSLVIRTG